MRLVNPCSSPLVALAATLSLLFNQGTMASNTPVFYDGFSVSASTSDMDFEIGAPRQGGPLAPVPYVVNSFPANSYHHQMFDAGTQPLQIAGDTNVLGFPTGTPALVSPNYNFEGAVGGGILGKCITFDLDVGSVINANDAGQYYTWAAFSMGGDAANVLVESNAKHFGIRFIEQNGFDLPGVGFGPFIQFMDGDEPGPFVVQNLLANPAGNGPMSVRIDIDDPGDGNPWDGVGSTTFDVFINNVQVGTTYTKGGGGFTNNFLTMEGMVNTYAFSSSTPNGGLSLHLFDNLTVYAAPIPEPATWALMGVGLCGMALRRRNRG